MLSILHSSTPRRILKSPSIPLSLVRLVLFVLAFEDGLAVLVKLELGDHTFRRVDAYLHRRAGSLLPRDTLDVDDPLLAIALHHLALTPLIRSPHYRHLVVLAHRHRTHLVLGAQLR